MFTRLLENPAFVSKIKCLNFDEAHFIVTSGQENKEGKVFRPEFSKGYEIRLRLDLQTPCTVYSATMPADVLDKILESLKIPRDPLKTCFISLSTNRPNLSFAVKKIDGSLSNLGNIDFVLPTLIHPPLVRLKKTLIFVPTTDSALDIEDRLNPRCPGSVQRIHSSLSLQYKEDIINEFNKPNGTISILITTPLLSNVSR